tara:strand:- start:6794 stop:7414 length:621 start_codon:yes stop_codon:yes gene_type:complete
MSFYDRFILPRFIDFACGTEGFRNKRSQILPMAYGDILEIGIGSGHNLEFYDETKVKTVRGIDPAEPSIKIAKQRLQNYNFPIKLDIGIAENLPYEDQSFDSVVIGYSLCTIPNVDEAMLEVRRVLKNEGIFLFTEHGLSPDPKVEAWQHRLTPTWKKIGGGCHLNRNIELIISKSGFKFEQLQKKYIKGPKILTYNYYGKAVKSS